MTIDSMDRLRELRREYSGYDPTIKLGEVFGTCTMGEFVELLNAYENLVLEREYSAGQVREITRLQRDRADHDLAVRDAIAETARTADELAFWRYQAIFWRAYAYDARLMSTSPVPEDEETWRTAERDLEAARVAENRERYAHAEPSRDPGAS